MVLFIRVGKDYNKWLKAIRQAEVTGTNPEKKAIWQAITPDKKNTPRKSQKRASKVSHLK